MQKETQRQINIRCIVPNLRARWKTELEPYSDNRVAALYEHFSSSDEFGDNDAKFPEWFEILPDMEED